MQSNRRMIRVTVSEIINKYNIIVFGVDIAGEIADAIMAAEEKRQEERKHNRGKRAQPSHMPPEVMTYHDITGQWPHAELYDDVIAGVGGKPLEVLRQAYKDWLKNGRNARSITWLKWAKCGSANRVAVVQ